MAFVNATDFLEAINLSWNFLKELIWPLFRAWGWVLPPLLLWRPFLNRWKLWRQELNIVQREFVLMEIKLPNEILKPIKAMEDVLSGLNMVVMDHDPGPWREKWVEGENTKMPSLAFEVASFGGETRFYVRTERNYQDPVIAAFYSHYPEIEMVEVEDYTKKVPQDVPNKDWNLEVREFVLKKEDIYPLKTYQELETGTEAKEEKRVDPIAKLLEALATLKQGEQVWFQVLIAKPQKNWVKEGEALRDKLSKRPAKKGPPKPMIQEAAELLVFGPKEEKKEEKDVIPPEMRLTPGEREILKEVERKMSKPGFQTTLRIIYLAKREAWFKPHLGLAISFLAGFEAGNLNRLSSHGPTSSKVKTIPGFLLKGLKLDERNSFVRKRAGFSHYQKRVGPCFPDTAGTSILNIEEIASIFHLPGRGVAPAPFVPRIEARKGEAPPNLPLE